MNERRGREKQKEKEEVTMMEFQERFGGMQIRPELPYNVEEFFGRCGWHDLVITVLLSPVADYRALNVKAPEKLSKAGFLIHVCRRDHRRINKNGDRRSVSIFYFSSG